MKETTIAAIATFPADSAIGIIRVSGKSAHRAASSVFRPAGRQFSSLKPNYASFGRIMGPSGVIDEAVLTLYKSPKSYTGEDMAEISCHGNPFILGKVMSLLINNGCEPAGPGEFTKRAFLNGKMDLSRAEAVADIITAKNDTALKIALNQLSGGASTAVQKLRFSLLNLLALTEAGIDFAHEDTGMAQPAGAARLAEKTAAEIDSLARNAEKGALLKDGIRAVIIGRPNAGKSSLLNAVSGADRAIVSGAPGTTRDTVEAGFSSGGLNFILTDTAGLRKARNTAEKQGVIRSKKAAGSADLSLLVMDASKKPGPADLSALRASKSGRLIVALNKCDLNMRVTPRQAASFLKLKHGTPVIQVSARTGMGIKTLTNTMKNIIISESAGHAGALTANLRHARQLKAAAKDLKPAAAKLRQGSFEEAAFYIKRASDALGAITGEISGEDVLAQIFKKFCIGK